MIYQNKTVFYQAATQFIYSKLKNKHPIFPLAKKAKRASAPYTYLFSSVCFHAVLLPLGAQTLQSGTSVLL